LPEDKATLIRLAAISTLGLRSHPGGM